MASQVKCVESHIANRKFFARCVARSAICHHLYLCRSNDVSPSHVLSFQSNPTNQWSLCRYMELDVLGCWVGCKIATRSFFSMCNSVVFPALSRPRNKILACLLRRPSEARTSQLYDRSADQQPREIGEKPITLRHRGVRHTTTILHLSVWLHKMGCREAVSLR